MVDTSFVCNRPLNGGSSAITSFSRNNRPPASSSARRAGPAFCKPPAETHESGGLSEEDPPNSVKFAASRCACCGRRSALNLLGGVLSASFKPHGLSRAAAGTPDAKVLVESIRGTRPEWYEKYFAAALENLMQSYEMQVEDKKLQLFNSLDDKAVDVLELGIGTGPNLRYYAKRPDLHVIGVDPNRYMEKYAKAAASAAGLEDSQFDFVLGVGEALPIESRSVDAVICTLVLCSVKDMAATLKEVKRVLKPGGSLLFMEHVAAPEGSGLRFWQDFLNPVQQFVADGCHLNRKTLDDIENARFDIVNAQSVSIPGLSVISPHIIGTARV